MPGDEIVIANDSCSCPDGWIGDQLNGAGTDIGRDRREEIARIGEPIGAEAGQRRHQHRTGS